MKNIMRTKQAKHLLPSTVVLMAFSSIASMLQLSLACDIESMLDDEDIGTKEEREKEVDRLVSRTAETCFKILGDALPIDIHTQEHLDKNDAAELMAFVEALNAKHGTSH
jgi:hypothetical protein